MTMTDTWAPIGASDAPHAYIRTQFRGATPFGTGVDGISVSRVRTLNVAIQGTDQAKATGPAVRGRPR